MSAEEHQQPSGSQPASAGGLDRDRIVDTALALVAGRGLEALSMRRLARELDAAPMSLYRHVGSKAELMALVVDRIAEGLPATDAEGPWDVTVRQVLRSIRRLLVAHPGIGAAVTNQALFTPSVLEATGVLLRALRSAGLGEREAARTFVVLWNYTLGGVMVEQSLLPSVPDGIAGRTGPVDPEALVAAQRERVVTALRQEARDLPEVHAAAAHWLDLDPEEAFEAGLDLLIAGIRPTA